MAFDFGCAVPLYHQTLHPRLLLGPDDLDRLRRRTGSGLGRTLLEALRRKSSHFVQQIHGSDRWRTLLREGGFFWPKHAESFAWALPDMALVGVLDNDGPTLDAVRQVIRELPSLGPQPRAGGLVCNDYYMPPLYLPYAFDLIAPHLEADDRRAYAAWALEAFIRQSMEQRRRRYLKSAAHNMTLGGMVQALLTLLSIRGEPGVPDLAAEEAELVRWFEATVHTSIGPEGYPEEDIGYGTVVVPYLAQLAEALTRAGVLDAFAACPRLAEFGNAMLHFVQPWGEFLSNTGDHGDQIRDRQFVLGRLAGRRKDPALLWLSGALTYTHTRTFPAEPVPDLEIELPLPDGRNVPVSWLSLAVLEDLDQPSPAPRADQRPTAFRDRARGLVSFRSGWGADDAFVVFDGSQRSPGGPGHAHDSCGHFALSALGEYFAISPGRYNIEQNCHNVVLVDGQSGRSTGGEWVADYHPGRLIAYQPGELVDYAAADSSHQHNCFWAWRYLGLVKGQDGRMPSWVWTVDDLNKANDWGEFWWQLHTSPENEITIEGSRATIRGWRQGNLLDVHFVLPNPASYTKPHALTLEQDSAVSSSTRYANPDQAEKTFARPSDMLHGPVHRRPRLLAKVAGYNGRFMALMLPRRAGEAPAQVDTLPTLDNALAVRVRFAQVEDTFIWAYEHHLLEAGDIVGRGQWCVVRRALATGEVLGHTLHEGTQLKVGDKEIR